MHKSLLTGFFALTLCTAAFADESKVDTGEAATASPDRLASLEASLAALQAKVVDLEGKLEDANGKIASLETEAHADVTVAAQSAHEKELEAKVAELEGKLSEVDARTGWAKAPPKIVALDDPGIGDGSLTVESPNIHGEVWLNGEGTGSYGPVTFKKLGAGTHKVEIKVDGRSVRSTKIKVDSSRNRRVVIF